MDNIVNWGIKPFITNAELSCVTVDGLEIENLFSQDPLVRSKGVRVESFVRPPVSLKLTFILPINLTHILIKTRLDDKETCRLRLSAGKETALKDCGCFVYSTIRLPLILHNNQWSKRENPSSFMLPNKVVGSQVHAKLLCQEITSQPLKITFNPTTLNIEFLHCSGPKPLAIQYIEIWGHLSKSATVEQKKRFEQVVHSLLSKESIGSSSSSSVSTKLYNVDCDDTSNERSHDTLSLSSTSTSTRSRNAAEVPSVSEANETPSKFLDALTYEVMLLPHILPSGYYVDQSSIDKSRELDLMNGRPPSDPFTGIPYSEHLRPTFCPELKAELDLYFSQHPMSQPVAKTVGSADDIVRHRQNLAGKIE